MARRPAGRRRAQPGGHPLRPEVVEQHRRARILAAAAEVVAERGYRQVSVADIVKRAATARSRFYENFSSKEDCFFALYDEAAEAALTAVGDACTQVSGPFPERVEAGIGALLEFIESDRLLARACVVEGPAVGPPINERIEHLISGFAALLRAGREGGDDLPGSVEETVVGGIYWMLYYALMEERPKRLRTMRPQLAEFSLIPFVGAEAARTASVR